MRVSGYIVQRCDTLCYREVPRKVAIWVEARSRTHGLAEAEKWAIARVASSQKLKPSTVGRRYRAYRQQQKQRGGK